MVDSTVQAGANRYWLSNLPFCSENKTVECENRETHTYRYEQRDTYKGTKMSTELICFRFLSKEVSLHFYRIDEKEAEAYSSTNKSNFENKKK